MNNFGKQLKRARKAADLTQTQAAMRGGWKQSAWCQYELGKIAPSISQAQRMCWVVGTTLTEVLKKA